MTGRLVSIVLLTVLLVSPAARSATLQVGQGGGFAFSTIQDAIDAASTGDTILVAPGIYTDTRDFTPGCCLTRPAVAAVTVDSLTIRGLDRDAVVIKGAEPGDPYIDGWGVAVGEGLKHVVLEDLTLIGWSNAILPSESLQATGVTIVSSRNAVFGSEASTLRVLQCRFDRCAIGVIVKQYSAVQVSISECEFVDVTTGVTTLASTGDITVSECSFMQGVEGVVVAINSDVDVVSCRFGPDQYFGVAFFAGSTGSVTGGVFDCLNGSLLLDEVQDVAVVNNRIRSGSTSAISLFSSCGNTIRDNILELGGETIVFASDYDHDGLCATVDLRNNYWHEMTNSEVHRAIHDANDDPAIGATVEFWPRLTERPVPNKTTTFGGLKGRYR